jgi:hypothetical protein
VVVPRARFLQLGVGAKHSPRILASTGAALLPLFPRKSQHAARTWTLSALRFLRRLAAPDAALQVPTRLLDWSRAPVVAAFFAVEPAMLHASGKCTTDACIWALAPEELNKSQRLEPLQYTLNARKLHDFIKPAFQHGVKELDSIAAAVPIEADIRMQVQQGVFTVHSTDKPLDELETADQWLRQFVIPCEKVHALAREIEVLGLRLASIFPDLENLAGKV